MRGLFKKNLGLKLFSLLLAVLLELHLIGPENMVETAILVNVEVRNLPANTMIVSPKGGDRGLFVKTRVRGPRNLVERIEPLSQRFFVELPTPPPSTFRSALSLAQLRLDGRIGVLSIEPPFIEIKLEPIVKKDLLVVVDRLGEPAKGFKFKNTKVTPETVIAKGPRSELDGFDLIKTQPIDIGGLEANSQRQVALERKGEFTMLAVDAVTVEVEIEPVITQRVISRARVKVSAPSGFAAVAEPSVTKLTLAGPQRSLDQLLPERVTMSANGAQLGAGQHELELQPLDLPEGVTVLKAEPSKVKVNLVAKPRS